MRATSSAATLALLLAAACGPSNPPPEGAPSTGQPGSGRTRILLDTLRRNRVIENDRPDAPPRAGMLVVANQQGASVTILNAATLQTIATLPVGTGPHEVAVSPDGRWAAVSIYGDRASPGSSLSVIDLGATPPVVSRTIDMGQYTRPHGVAFVLGGAKLAVTSETMQRLAIVDFASGRVDTALATNARGSHMVTVRRDGRRAWTANVQDGTVTEFDLDLRHTGRTFPGASMNEGIAASPAGSQVWVGSNDQHAVTVLDAAGANKVATIEGIGFAYRIGISRSGRAAVVNDPTGNRIWIYEAPTRRKLAELDLAKTNGVRAVTAPAGQIAAGPEGVAFDPIAEFAYVTLNGTNQVVAVDLGQLKITAVGSVGAGPDGIAFSPMAPRP